ncbi:MAG: hypothetical protein ACYS99_08060 [Planctomycetota bacterium]
MDAPPADAKGLALISTGMASGSIILAGAEGRVTLVWKAGEKDRARALPPGAYRLLTTRVERRMDDVHWFLSSTGPAARGKLFELKAGETTRIDVDEAVHFKGRGRWKKGALRIGFAITAGDGRGLSVFKAGRRVPVTYEVLSPKGAVLTKGPARYG